MKPEIFEYDWLHDKQPSHSIVDISCAERPAVRNAHPYLLTLCLHPRKKNSKDRLGPWMRYRSGSITRKLQKICKGALAVWVGTRQYANRTELFFYGAAEENLRWLAQQTHSRALHGEDDIVPDKNWSVYDGSIYPSAAQKQVVKNEIWFQRMKKSGDSITIARRINHYLLFPNELERVKFEGMARQAGFVLGDPFFAPEAPLAYGICVHHRSAILLEQINQSTTRLVEVASPFGGQYEYWDCALIPRH